VDIRLKNGIVERRKASGRKMRSVGIILLLSLLFIPFSNVVAMEGKKMGEFRISSPAFKNNDAIPSRYACDDIDVNPPLLIENVPPAARSLVLIVDDPDAPAGTWVHWVVWNIDPGLREIRENSVPKGGVEGVNDFRRHNYGGPCPPSGTHRYFFKLYALDKTLGIAAHSEKAHVEKAMDGHVIARAQIIGRYRRAR
jgi:Raf kinase inhibitor-like YbhB/YbcL family protein